MILRFSVSILIIIVHLVRIVYFFSLKNKILTGVYLEVEMEFAGRLKKVRIKLIMIGICLIFLGGYSLIQEWKDQEKNTTKKVFDQYTDTFFKENISTNEMLQKKRIVIARNQRILIDSFLDLLVHLNCNIQLGLTKLK